jgi:hypothetical protein
LSGETRNPQAATDPFAPARRPGVLRLETLDSHLPPAIERPPVPPPGRRSPFSPGILDDRDPPGERKRADDEDEKPDLEPELRADLRKKIDRDIRDMLGRQLRDLDVNVTKKGVVEVEFRTRWFWQRRAARRAIESLPFGDRLDLQIKD